MVAFLALHDVAVHWPTDEEKERAKEWVESVSCAEWRDGFCMVDGWHTRSIVAEARSSWGSIL
jgi:hypothetical protein